MDNWVKNEIKALLDITENEKDKKAIQTGAEAFMSIYQNKKMTKSRIALAERVYVALVTGEPLVPIQNREEDWVLVSEGEMVKYYHHARRPSLFRKTQTINEKECHTYGDTERSTVVEMLNLKVIKKDWFAQSVLDKECPIEFPYNPVGKIRLYTEHFSFKGSDFLGVICYRLPDDTLEQTHFIRRYFKRGSIEEKYTEISDSIFQMMKWELEKEIEKKDSQK